MMIYTNTNDRDSNTKVRYLKTHLTDRVRINIHSRALCANLEAQKMSSIVYKCSQNHPMLVDELTQLHSYVKSEVEKSNVLV